MTLFSWSLSSSLALKLSTSFPQGSLNPEAKDLRGHPVLELSVPRCLGLSLTSGCGSLILFPSTAGGSFSHDGWTRHWSMSIQNVIKSHFIPMFAKQTNKKPRVVFGFTLGPRITSLRFLVTQAVLYWEWVPSHEMGLKSNQTLVGYSPELCTTVALAYLEGRTPLSIQGSMAGFVFLFLFW